MSGSFLNSYAGQKLQPFLWLDFEGTDASLCKATGQQFASTNGGDPSAVILSQTGGRWGQGFLDGNNQTSGTGSYKFVSLAYRPEWDFLSNVKDYCIACYIKMHHYSTVTKYAWVLGCEAGDSNTFSLLSVRQSGGNAVFQHTFPQSATFTTSVSQSIPLTFDWVFVVCARFNGVGYISVDGAASPTGVAAGVGLAAPQNCGFGICNGTLQDLGTGQLGGFVDHVHGYRGLPYNVINGFTVPASAPAY